MRVAWLITFCTMASFMGLLLYKTNPIACEQPPMMISIAPESFVRVERPSTAPIKPPVPLNPCWGKQKMNGCIPQFIVIGAQKGGTTAMFAYLSLHPQIRAPKDKEICSLQTQEYFYGQDHYWAKFPNLSHAEGVVTGEACPGYMLYPWAAKRTRDWVPNAKIIALLREPVERSFSQYQMFHGKGMLKKVSSFEGLLNYSLPHVHEIKDALEECRVKNLTNEECSVFHANWYWTDIFLTSMYSYQLKLWYDQFPKDQILILQSEKFWANTSETMSTVFKFLGLSDYKLEGLKPVFPGSYDSELSNQTRKRLNDELFTPYTEELYKMLGWEDDYKWRR